jgi:flagellar biosynthesis protein FliR
MDWLNINVLQFQYFLIVMARIMTMVTMAPIIGSRSVPAPAKVGFGFMLSLIIFPFVVRDFPPLPESMILFFGLMVRESLVGILMGLIGSAMFAAVQLSGQISGVMIGFGIVNVIDPLSDLQISILGQFEFLLAILLFLGVGGHHLLITAMANSYAYLPVGVFTVTGQLADQIAHLLGNMFAVAYKVGFPAIAAIFIMQVAMGIIARTVPQMNIFIVGMPLNIFVGMLVMFMSLGYVTYLFIRYFDQLFQDMYIMFVHAAGR